MTTACTIALIRHFPTDWNGERRMQGHIDRPLTDAARARLAGLALPPAWAGAAVVASPLSRAAETARFLADGRPIRVDPRLMELSWGAWEGKRSDEVPKAPDGAPLVHRLGWRGRPPGGESAADGWARVLPALARLARGGDPAVVVTHKALMRVILGQGCGWSGPDAGTVEIKRGRLYRVDLASDGTPSTDPDAPPDRLVPRASELTKAMAMAEP
ncbi:MAG: histidine phosphatase family protein [Pseudomonadota bacterium]